MNYCTLFNHRYLARGTTMVESLLQQDSQADITVFSMDEATSNFLKRKFAQKIRILPLENLETPEYKKLKTQRGFGEYCWTLTPRVLDYCLSDLKQDHSIYVDADCYFFNSPAEKTKAWTQNCDVMITAHNYAKEYDQSRTSGVFCVQYVFIKSTDNGRKILEEWRQQCVEWCFARHEDGKFGDQKYLDAWPQKAGVLVCPEIGFGVAPWNASRLEIKGTVYRDLYTGQEAPVTFYHFHDFKFYDWGLSDLSSYRLGSAVKQNIYKPYIEHLNRIKLELPEGTPNDWLQYPTFKSMARWSKRLFTMGDLNLLW